MTHTWNPENKIGFLKNAKEIYLPNVYVNTVIFSYHHEKLNTLILRFSDSEYYMLSGGNVMNDEDLSEAAKRSLIDRLDIENIYLEQFYTTETNILPNQALIDVFLEKTGPDLTQYYLLDRKVRVCYYALIDEDKLHPATKDSAINEFKWVDIHDVPDLIFGHSLIIEKAKERLQDDFDKKISKIGKGLMNETFTMKELQTLYEAVYDKKFARTNFQRRILGLDILERLEKVYNGLSHKAPYLYRFK